MKSKEEDSMREDVLKHTTLGQSMVSAWWPNQLNLKILHQNPHEMKPFDPDFDYSEAFKKLDYNALKPPLPNT